MKITMPIKFEGTIEVDVPDEAAETYRNAVAENAALLHLVFGVGEQSWERFEKSMDKYLNAGGNVEHWSDAEILKTDGHWTINGRV